MDFSLLCTSRKNVISIPDAVIRIFYWFQPSGRIMALGVDSTSNRNKYHKYFLGEGGVKAAGSWGSAYHLHVPTI
jgi:hypothetical protein